MKYIIAAIIVLMPLSLFAADNQGSVVDGSVTWTFDSATYTTGQFVTGDWWVIPDDGDVDVVSITPAWSSPHHGSQLNPTPDETQGYTGTSVYSEAKNAALDLPLALVAGDMLVSAIGDVSGSDADDSNVVATHILTVLATAPPAGSFRPGYCDTSRTMHNTSSIFWNRLAALTPTASTPSFASMQAVFVGAFVDVAQGASYVRPGGTDLAYGRDFTEAIANAVLLLNCNYTQSQKESLLYKVIQLGIDLYSVIINDNTADGMWLPDGGRNCGRKLPILFAGSLLNNSAMLAIGAVSGDSAGLVYASETITISNAAYKKFAEDDQTYYVNQNIVDLCGWSNWSPDGTSPDAYTAAHIGMPEWGIRPTDAPKHDASWTATYRGVVGSEYCAMVLSAKIMGLQAFWNHDSLFDYADRYYGIVYSGGTDPFGYTTIDPPAADTTPLAAFPQEMWAAYKAGAPYINIVLNSGKFAPTLNGGRIGATPKSGGSGLGVTVY